MVPMGSYSALTTLSIQTAQNNQQAPQYIKNLKKKLKKMLSKALITIFLISLYCDRVIETLAQFDNNDDEYSDGAEETNNLEVKKPVYSPAVRQMAQAIVKELERRPKLASDEIEQSEARAGKIITEVNEEYVNIAKKINQLNRERRRLRRIEGKMRRKRRMEILKNLRRYYVH